MSVTRQPWLGHWMCWGLKVTLRRHRQVRNGCESRRGRPQQRPSQGNEESNRPPADVRLQPAAAESGGCGRCMVFVAPALAPSAARQPANVGAAGGRVVPARTRQMAPGIDRPDDVMAQRQAHHATPRGARQRALPSTEPSPARQCGQYEAGGHAAATGAAQAAHLCITKQLADIARWLRDIVSAHPTQVALPGGAPAAHWRAPSFGLW